MHTEQKQPKDPSRFGSMPMHVLHIIVLIKLCLAEHILTEESLQNWEIGALLS